VVIVGQLDRDVRFGRYGFVADKISRMSWFSWLVLGFALLAGEVLVSASFFLLFFGVGALIVGALAGIGVTFAPWLEWVVFAGISVALLVMFRNRLVSQRDSGGDSNDADSLVGVRGRVNGSIAPGARGQGEFRGSLWQVHNVGGTLLAAGDECEVRAVEGLTLAVAKADR